MSKTDYIFEINNYIALYGSDLSFKSVTIESLKNNIETLDECADFIVDLLCKIGLRDDSEPNEEGHKLEKCLDYINNIRYKHFN